MAHVHSKVLLTATPLQNSLVELYGLVSIIDDRVFGDLDSFRAQFTSSGRDQAFAALRERLATVCKRTLRKQVQPYVSYTARKAIVQEFTPSNEEQELSRLVADYLRRPNLQALPQSQRQLISSSCGSCSRPARTPLRARWKRWPSACKACSMHRRWSI
jgi:SNF2 family DNA or RNA helicase